MEHATLDDLVRASIKKLHESLDDIESLNQWRAHMVHLIDEICQAKVAASRMATAISNTSLDPADWLSARNVAHRALDSAMDIIQSRRDQPVWQPVPAEVRSLLNDDPLPKQGEALSTVCHDVFTHVSPYARGNTHPRFWGWAMGEGTLGGVIADTITSTMNINAGGCSHSAVLVERKVIHWMREVFGFPRADHGGTVVSGTSMATVLALATARRRSLSNVRTDGMFNGPRLIVYASTEAHMCVSKAMELLGLGSKAIHSISVDQNFCMIIDELKVAIEKDRKNGSVPFCIIGNAGTVNTGAFDDLLALAAIARAENLWFHVDGAFGSLVILDPRRRHLVRGVELADSLAFDFHKWLHCPYDAGCVLVRDGADLLSTFSVHQSYLAHAERGCAGDKPWYCDLGTELSRSFRALKVWFTLKEHGTIRLGQKIADNCEQAQYLASLLAKYEYFIRVLRPVTLNIVNFRVEPEGLDRSNETLIDVFNNDLLADVQISGIAVASTTRLHGRLYIRVCIISHRSTLSDFEIFVDHLLALYRLRLQNVQQLTE